MEIFETYQEFLIVCDNDKCDYKIENESGDFNTETKEFINIPCPKCGHVLLTQEDYDTYKDFAKTINWLNKWFGWLSVFYSKKRVSGNFGVKINKGIKIDNL